MGGFRRAKKLKSADSEEHITTVQAKSMIRTVSVEIIHYRFCQNTNVGFSTAM